jgi:hypothetical protein
MAIAAPTTAVWATEDKRGLQPRTVASGFLFIFSFFFPFFSFFFFLIILTSFKGRLPSYAYELRRRARQKLETRQVSVFGMFIFLINFIFC